MAKVVLWLGPSLERWDPATALDCGIGGSETAAIHLSRELAFLGHVVNVYADVTKSIACTWANVSGYASWEPYQNVPAHLLCDLFISSRQPEARRKVHPSCQQAWLWVHDVHCGPDWDNVIKTDYDKVLCLSSFARGKFLEYYPALDPAKVVKTWNGLDAKLFENVPEILRAGFGKLGGVHGFLNPGDQHLRFRRGLAPLRATYSSSPDRGLDKLLDLWPRVCELGRLACPDNHLPPELHVYYGFETWRKVAERHGDVTAAYKIALLEEKVGKTPGVCYHGRASQAEVARSHLESQLWLYPTDFVETSCITAMEAQAAGCQVVSTRLGALPETAPAGWFVDGPTSVVGYDERFLACVREALLEDASYAFAPRSWASVARQWDAWMWEGE